MNRRMDWQQSLQQFLDSNPDLPKGEEMHPEDKTAGNANGSRLDIMFERKGRAGKEATIIAGFDPSVSDDEISSVASTLKKKIGTGGSSRGGEILIQGDRRNEVKKILETLGYRARII